MPTQQLQKLWIEDEGMRTASPLPVIVSFSVSVRTWHGKVSREFIYIFSCWGEKLAFGFPPAPLTSLYRHYYYIQSCSCSLRAPQGLRYQSLQPHVSVGWWACSSQWVFLGGYLADDSRLLKIKATCQWWDPNNRAAAGHRTMSWNLL